MNIKELRKQESETRDEFLVRGARMLDSMRTGIGYEKGPCLNDILSQEEMKDLKNYIMEQAYPVVYDRATYLSRRWSNRELVKDYINEFAFKVWEELHLYNNPRYFQKEYNAAFLTFVKNYEKDSARKVRLRNEGVGKNFDDKRRAITRAKKFIVQELNVNIEDVTADDIAMFLPSVTTLHISRKEIERMMCICQPAFCLDSYNGDVDDVLGQIKDDKVFADDDVKVALADMINKMCPIQKWCFLQHYGYCSKHYANMTIKELGADPDFVKACREDKKGMKHIKKGDVHVHRPGGRQDVSAVTFNDIDYVEEKFIRNLIESARANLVSCVKEKEFGQDEIEDNLFALMAELWKQLAVEMKIK